MLMLVRRQARCVSTITGGSVMTGRGAMAFSPQKRGMPVKIVMPTPAVTRPRMPVRLDASCADRHHLAGALEGVDDDAAEGRPFGVGAHHQLLAGEILDRQRVLAASGWSRRQQRHQPVAGDRPRSRSPSSGTSLR